MNSKYSILRNQRNTKDAGEFRPQLTSLIDVMTILLVFLIKSFSAEGNFITPSQDLVLPKSISEERVQQKFTIEVTEENVVFDGKNLASVKDIRNSDSLIVAPLFTWMEKKHNELKQTGKPHEIMIQADKNIEFAIIKKVMATCNRAGFKDFSVLVITEG